MKRPERLTHGDAPIVSKYRDKMNILARFLDVHFNGKAKGTDRKVGFVLLVFPFNDDTDKDEPRVNYISNGGNRRDMINLFKEMIARFERQPDMDSGTKQ